MAKSKQTKAHEIPMAVKKAVARRDGIDGHPCCIYCGKPAPTDYPLAFCNAHVIKRSQGGMGVVTNIVTLCSSCHHRFDDSTDREEMMHYISSYLKRFYKNWSEEAQVYRKDQEDERV